MVQVIAGVASSSIVSDPPVIIRVHVRRIGMSRLLGKMAPLILLRRSPAAIRSRRHRRTRRCMGRPRGRAARWYVSAAHRGADGMRSTPAADSTVVLLPKRSAERRTKTRAKSKAKNKKRNKKRQREPSHQRVHELVHRMASQAGRIIITRPGLMECYVFIFALFHFGWDR